jgi:ubiquinone/menaquinone biosynthesis C-methylase UbiE
MEERKQKEIEYYDKRAGESLRDFSRGEIQGDFEDFNPFILESYNFLRKFLIRRCEGKKVLDYGCGNGIHSIWLAKRGAEIIGIDLSKNSLQIAKEKAEKKGVENNVKFLLMDCENLKFPDKFFDIIFDGGTFSSLDFKKILPELARILNPDGFLIGIETLGHNPLTNLKRKINKITGKRTEWAVSHILRMENLKQAEKYFSKIETYFFHLISWSAFPFLNLPGGKILLNLLEKLDSCLLYMFPFFKKYSFKIVFIFSKPKY